MDTLAVPTVRVETVKTVDTSQGDAVDASSVQAGRAEKNSGASLASGIVPGNGDDHLAILSGKAGHELSSWGSPPPTVMGRTRGRSQRLRGGSAQRQPAVGDAIPGAV